MSRSLRLTVRGKLVRCRRKRRWPVVHSLPVPSQRWHGVPSGCFPLPPQYSHVTYFVGGEAILSSVFLCRSHFSNAASGTLSRQKLLFGESAGLVQWMTYWIAFCESLYELKIRFANMGRCGNAKNWNTAKPIATRFNAMKPRNSVILLTIACEHSQGRCKFLIAKAVNALVQAQLIIISVSFSGERKFQWGRLHQGLCKTETYVNACGC
jgi:hypothetical protein